MASAILRILIEEALLAMLLLWLLPQLGIRLPMGLVIGILIALAAWSTLVYKAVRQIVPRELPGPAEAMLNRRGIAVTKLAPKGAVRIRGEIWGAVSSNGDITPGDEISVSGIDGLRLTVRKEEESV